MREREIRERIADYLAGETSLAEFAGSLTPATWDLNEEADSCAADLAYDVLLALAEHEHGHLEDMELRARLARLLHVAHIGRPSHQVTATASATLVSPWRAPSRVFVADTEFAGVSD